MTAVAPDTSEATTTAPAGRCIFDTIDDQPCTREPIVEVLVSCPSGHDESGPCCLHDLQILLGANPDHDMTCTDCEPESAVTLVTVGAL